PAARAAGGRVHRRRRPHADPRRRAHRRRDAPRPAPDGPLGAVPRGPLLSPERRADPPAAAARADRGHSRTGAPLPHPAAGLRAVLQGAEPPAVGGRRPIPAAVRIVAATHRDLRQMVRSGLFREDLFYRLSVVPIRLPPLRERTEDIPELARHFLTQAQAEGL